MNSIVAQPRVFKIAATECALRQHNNASVICVGSKGCQQTERRQFGLSSLSSVSRPESLSISSRHSVSASRRPLFAVSTDTPVTIESEVDFDYGPLEAALKEGNFREADDLTRAHLITLAGEDAQDRDFVYFTEVANIPVTDLKTIDALWVHYSDGKFGYSVQKKIWKQCKEQWGKFFKNLDWTTGENNAYRSWKNNEYIYTMEAAKGHLPLTSCLRGTQLLRGLLENEAFAGPAAAAGGGKGDAGGAAGGKPDWLKF